MSSATNYFASGTKDRSNAIEIALDKEQMQPVFASKIKERFDAGLQVQDISIEVLRRHSNRCVLRYRIDAFDPQRAKYFQWNVIGKVLRADLGEKVFDNMQQLWGNGFARDAEDGISIPEPLEFIPTLSMLLQEEVPGLPVRTLIRQTAQKEHFRQVARILAKLHKCPIVPSKIFKVRDHLMRCHPKHEFISLACPELAPSIDYIVDQAYRIEANFHDLEFTPLHGDFHLGQVHLEEDHAWLIDFDALSYGDPASDLGNLMVFLKDKVRRNSEVNDLINVFLDEYFLVMDRGIAARMPLYEALTHLRRACKSLRLQEEGWEQRVKRMVEQGVVSINEMLKSQKLADYRDLLVDSNNGSETSKLSVAV